MRGNLEWSMVKEEGRGGHGDGEENLMRHEWSGEHVVVIVKGKPLSESGEKKLGGQEEWSGELGGSWVEEIMMRQEKNLVREGEQRAGKNSSHSTPRDVRSY